MSRTALGNGLNFIDFPHWTPDVRDTIGSALGGIRKKVMLSAHLGITHKSQTPQSTNAVPNIWSSFFKTREPNVCQASFDDMLLRLRTDYIDVLFISWVDDDLDFDKAFDVNGYLGLSTHTTPIGMKALDSGLIDAIMFPVNPAHDLFPGEKGLELMWKKDPYRELPDAAKSSAEYRKEFYLACERNKTGLFAMKPYAGGLLLQEGRVLDSAEHHLTEEVRAEYRSLERKATDCTQCAECVERCPFGVDVPARMEHAVQLFDE